MTVLKNIIYITITSTGGKRQHGADSNQITLSESEHTNTEHSNSDIHGWGGFRDPVEALAKAAVES